MRTGIVLGVVAAWLAAWPAVADEPPALAEFTDTLADGSPCDYCPTLIVMPQGTFMMGSPATEDGRKDHEGPQREVTVPAFAIGKFEVTFAQYDRFADVTGAFPADDRGWGRDDRPVAGVSYRDAWAYAAWLSKKTGQLYRLPTEAEWEYAARAGTTDRFWRGELLGADQATFDHVGGPTTPVGSYDANPWGLHDVHGNVAEWVSDCWFGDLDGAPDDGSAWLEPDGVRCELRVRRGGSYANFSYDLRSAARDRADPGSRYSGIGFRLARSLAP